MRILSPLDSTVNSFYLAFYGRPADPAGLAFWSEQLANNNGDLTAITQVFATSEEAQVRFGSGSVTERIADIYQNLFNRAPEADGLAYWTEVIEHGHASIADVAIAILHGARGADAQLSDLRQQAADGFTAQVHAASSGYSGYASIEAARILVRAVTLDATSADLDTLVGAAVSLANTATNKPHVVEALAVNTTLLALFDTPRGLGDPVALAQALANTAWAAAGNPDTLDSLLRGGGMAKVLEVMPSDATLQDVVDALASGGLPAAVEVVYPSPPVVTPMPEFALSFAGVTEGAADAKADHVTNQQTVEVKFSYTGDDLNANQYFEYSVDGKNWLRADDVATNDNVVTIKGIDLAQGTPAGGLPSLLPHLSLEGSLPLIHTVSDPHADLTTTVTLRAVTATGTVLASSTQAIVYDTYAATPGIVFDTSATDPTLYQGSQVLSRHPGFTLEGTEADAKVEFANTNLSSDGKDFIAGAWNPHVAVQQGENNFYVRQLDAAGNLSDPRLVTFTYDSIAPARPIIALVQDSGSDTNDGLTNVGQVAITGLDTDTGTAWQYSLDLGITWSARAVNDGTGSATLVLVQNGYLGVLVRQVDAAGNIGYYSELLELVLDTVKPDTTLGFGSLDAPTAPGAHATLADSATATFTYSANATGQTFEWRLADGKWGPVQDAAIDSANRTITIAGIDLTQADQTVELRAIDAAGNRGDIFSQPIDGPAGNPTLSVLALPPGVILFSEVAGTIELAGPGTTVTVASTSPDQKAVIGPNLVGAQQSIVTGIFQVVPQGGAAVVDKDAKMYSLGTDRADIIGGNQVWAFGGDDTLVGTRDADILVGGDGLDTLLAFEGDDILLGGAGADRLSGGAGADSFELGSPGDSTLPMLVNGVIVGGYDTITDFNAAEGDTISLGASIGNHIQHGIGFSSTLFASLDELIAHANTYFPHATYPAVFAGQVGRDVFVVGIDDGVRDSVAFIAGRDPALKLQNTSVLDLGIKQFVGFTRDYREGNGTVQDDAAPAGNTVEAASPHLSSYLRGLDGEDLLVGSTTADILIGGEGGDTIESNGGADIVVIDTGADSNFSFLWNDGIGQSYDIVTNVGSEPVVFDFSFNVLHTATAVMAPQADGDAGAFFAALNAAYDSVALTRYDAVLMDISGSQFVIANNGDGTIDANDIAVEIVGTGSIGVDVFGNVVYTENSILGGGIPG